MGDVETISQRRMRNDSGEILRRAAAGEHFRVAAGDRWVDLVAGTDSDLDRLAAAGELSEASDDDFADFPTPSAGVESLDDTFDAMRRES